MTFGVGYRFGQDRRRDNPVDWPLVSRFQRSRRFSRETQDFALGYLVSARWA
jgi:hypothetical protein